MKLGIISDTHDTIEAAKKALKIFKQRGVDLVVHAGDWVNPGNVDKLGQTARQYGLPLEGVAGNNDTAIKHIIENLPKKFEAVNLARHDVLKIETNQQKIAVYHGHDKTVLKSLVDSGNHDVVITGHTHRPKIDTSNNVLIINPGSTALTLPHKSDHTPTAAIYDSDKHTTRIIPL